MGKIENNLTMFKLITKITIERRMTVVTIKI